MEPVTVSYFTMTGILLAAWALGFSTWHLGNYLSRKTEEDTHECPSSAYTPEVDETLPKLRSDIDSLRRDMQRQLDSVPGKVLESITSSTNGHKGRLGEMIGYISLSAKYDRLIAFGDITDFIGITFDKNGEGGSIDFIDIKNGKNAKLSKDQQRLKKLIEEKKINFIKVKVDTDASQDQPE
jgi:predicted Holliday junction resolvase-like endonuclease